MRSIPPSTRNIPFALLAAILLLAAGCDTTTDDPQAEVVVEAYLAAGDSLPPVYLRRAISTDATFDPDAGLSGAAVGIAQIAPDGTPVDSFAYEETLVGTYEPVADRGVRVQPRHTYRLYVQAPENAPVTASTTVPGAIELVRSENERAVYQGPEQPSFTVTPSEVEGRQSVFIFTTTSQLDFTQPTDSIRAQLTPFYADIVDDDDSLTDFRVTSSPPLNEANYTTNPDGTLTIDLPWIAVAFYGPNIAAISAVDDNLFDFIRTQQAQQGGLAPGEIPNVLDPVQGGVGIFGSYARTTRAVDVLRPSLPDVLP
jgi:hypothetical protein